MGRPQRLAEIALLAAHLASGSLPRTSAYSLLDVALSNSVTIVVAGLALFSIRGCFGRTAKETTYTSPAIQPPPGSTVAPVPPDPASETTTTTTTRANGAVERQRSTTTTYSNWKTDVAFAA